ncbi:hypothetical protein [Bacillus sp. 7894-2]|uniref:hypothetical protein n=1 Tax=Bacillus sp. 7894-2 TaxID=2021695 RepID=UPI000BA65BF8|nr:hypothetical protein [Bacillus sp. 7894-2]PAE25164.1 hypothetical protein CHI10_08615 [Bacillus sp. 7894-2]
MLDKDEKDRGYTEDPLTHFLFGERVRNKPDGGKIEFESSAEEHQGKDDWLFGGRNRNAHEADDWLLGGKSRETTERESSGKENENNILNNINFEELMGNIDTLMSSAHHLKPLLKKAGPLLEMFWKK